MIIYRPHKGGLAESMLEAREFETIAEMKAHIVKSHTIEGIGPAFSADDIVIDDMAVCDERVGWKDTRYVCVKRYYNEDYMAKYGTPQCVGMCATKYGPQYNS